MNKKNGFTIIEVSLVLAVAGLIMLLVFFALPGLQRSQRDSRRKDDIMKLADSIKKYQSNNNRGSLPSSTTELKNNVISNFIGADFDDPSGLGGYKAELVVCSGNTGTKCAEAKDRPAIVVATGASCGDNNVAVKNANGRKGAILYKLETGNNVAWCYEF